MRLPHQFPRFEMVAGALGLCLLAACPALAAGPFSVPGTASPYLAGMPPGSPCCSLNGSAPDSAPAESPTQVTGVTLSPGAVLTFTVSGSVSNDASQAPHDPPDGGDFFEVIAAGVKGTQANNGISSINAPVNALVGVFLDDNLPTASPAPPGLDFGPNGRGMAFTSLSPALKQVFFIGDGLTGSGTGTAQQFVVPAGASRLFLGTVDGFQWSTNSGAFSVVVNGAATGPGPLAAALLPLSRSVQVGATATVFATIINAGGGTANDCGIALATGLPAAFSFQTTNPANNSLIGQPNTRGPIGAGAFQTYVIALTPSASFGPTDVNFAFQCGNTGPAANISGIDTLLLSASQTPTPDVIALALSPTNDGILDIPGANGTGAFAVATTNIGAADTLTVSADTGSASLPITLTLCESTSGNCVPAPAITVSMAAGATPTFSVFAAGHGVVNFDPGGNRIFVRFKDSSGVTRGSTGVAVRTQ